MLTLFNLLKLGPTGLVIIGSMIVFVNPGLFTFFTASTSERLLMKKEWRYIRTFAIYFYFLVVFPLTLIGFLKDSSFITYKISQFLNQYTYVIMAAITIIFLSLLILYQKKNWLYKFGKSFWTKLFFAGVSTLYILIVVLIFSITSLCMTDFNAGTKLYVVAAYLIYSIPYFLVARKILHENILVTIRLSGNEAIKHGFFLYPSYGKRIWIGNDPNPQECSHKICVPLDKIEMIEFNIRHFAWGKELIKYKEKPRIQVMKKEELNQREIIIAKR